MYLLLFILLPAVTLTNGKPTLIASLGKLGLDETELDIVTIDPTNGNVSKLYTLPSLYSLWSDIFVYLRVHSERHRIYILPVNFALGRSFVHELSLVDGHLINTYNISQNQLGTPEYYTQWDFDPDTRTLYGLCMNDSNTTLHNNFVWCSVKFDENGVGKTRYGFYAGPDGDPPGPWPYGRMSMNRNTFSTGEYWYTEDNDIFVRSVNTQTGEPGEVIWTIEDKPLINVDPPTFVAVVTGKTKEYAIVMREDGWDINTIHLIVVKLKSGVDEELIAKIPTNLIADGPPYAYDPNTDMLYVLMKTDFKLICDTLVMVNLSQPNSVHTIPAPIKSLYDPAMYFVNDMHLIEWPPTTPNP